MSDPLPPDLAASTSPSAKAAKVSPPPVTPPRGAPLPVVETTPAENAPTENAPAESASHRPRLRHLLDLSLVDLQAWLAAQGEKPFRAAQVWRWVYFGRAQEFESMSDLPRALRQLLADHFVLFATTINRHQTSPDGTEKLLIGLAGGGEVECVLLREGPRRSICVSSQVGCAMGCVFCASGLDGVERNLTRGEILEQMLRLQHRLDQEERLSHIVMMGMGEPLANLDRVLGALDIARSPEGLGISPRRVTISTVGLPPAIDRLAKHGVPYNLAVSLHAPNDELRNRLVPVNRKVGVAALMQAADRYFESSGRRLTFEYVLLGDLNDSQPCAQQLGQLLRGRGAMLNVIPYNPVAGLPYRTPNSAAINRFRDVLERHGVNVNFRVRKGGEIDAACGQLRRNRGQLAADAPAAAPLQPDPTRMNANASIILELTGPLERAVGQDEVAIAWAGEGRLGDLLRQFCCAYPAAAELLGGDAHWASAGAEYPAGILVIRDSAALAPRMDTAIAAGDRLTLMPLISGG